MTSAPRRRSICIRTRSCRWWSPRRRSSPSRASRQRPPPTPAPTPRRAADAMRDGGASEHPGVRRIYLVRHGETLYQGVSGDPIALRPHRPGRRAAARGCRAVPHDRGRSRRREPARALLRHRDDHRRSARPAGRRRRGSARDHGGPTTARPARDLHRGTALLRQPRHALGHAVRRRRPTASCAARPAVPARVLADPSWQTLVAVAHGGINNALLSVVPARTSRRGCSTSSRTSAA